MVVVVTRDGTVFAKGYGFADIAARKPFTSDKTLVRPGSISKLFTAIAVMQLVDAGRLDLDRDVNAYIDFAIPTPQGGVPVTLRRLLTHRAGFENHLKGLFSRGPEPEPLGRWLAKSLPPRLFPTGDVEAYSNYGFALAGYIVERVSGEAFASYIGRHILDPLGMRHSTFQQPLPDELAPLMAKGARTSDTPPIPFFETIIAPAGALSATGSDIGRFMRALLNGGELDGVRILPKHRLDEMMAPAHATPAGYLGLAFFGAKIAGHDAIGHGGETMTFFSALNLLPKQGIGIFVSRDGNGEMTSLEQLDAIPDPTALIADRFLPKAPQPSDALIALPGNADIAGVYQPSRRQDSSFMRLADLMMFQRVLEVESDGNLRSFSTLWPFSDGRPAKRIGQNVYEAPSGRRLAFVDGTGSGPHLAQPGFRFDRAPWLLDLRWIGPALAASILVVIGTLLAWPVAALVRYWRKRRWSEGSGDRRKHRAVRLVLLVDLVVIAATMLLFARASVDYTIFSESLDPLLLGLYFLAWLGVVGSVLIVWAAISFWRNGAGSPWSRIHHTLIAASSVMLAWFFITFRIAGTTLNY